MVVVPFVSQESDSEGLPTPVQNQLIVRSSQGIGKGLSSMGIASVAYSTTMETTVTLPRATILTRQQARRRGWKGWQGEKTTFRPGNPFAETKWMEKTTRRKQWGPGTKTRPSNVKKLAKVGVRTGGGSAVVLGKALPYAAYGYVGYTLLTGNYPEYEPPQDPWGLTPIVEELPGVTKKTIDTFNQNNATIMNYTSYGVAVAKTLVLGGIIDGLFGL